MADPRRRGARQIPAQRAFAAPVPARSTMPVATGVAPGVADRNRNRHMRDAPGAYGPFNRLMAQYYDAVYPEGAWQNTRGGQAFGRGTGLRNALEDWREGDFLRQSLTGRVRPLRYQSVGFPGIDLEGLDPEQRARFDAVGGPDRLRILAQLKDPATFMDMDDEDIYAAFPEMARQG